MHSHRRSLVFQLLFVASASSSVCDRGCLSLVAFFDVSADGLRNNAEPNITGWQFKVASLATNQSVNLTVTADLKDLPVGAYQVCDSDPSPSTNWYRTPYGIASCKNVTVVNNTCTTVDFPRLCVGSGNISTAADWMTQPYLDSLTQSDLDALTALNLKTASGADFTPTSAAVFLAWLNPYAAASVPLGSAASYAVVAGSAVTSTGFTTINGDLALFPGTAVSGFPPATLNGVQHLSDPTALQAQSDLTFAYQNAAGRGPPIAVTTDLGGMTLTPGVYHTASSIGLTGMLTLDALGNSNAVFVFQAGSTLTLASGSSIILANGAQARNVFWQIGSSATMEANSVFVGTVMAYTSISLSIGATVNGRLLASNGAVSMNANTITVPAQGSNATYVKYLLSVQLAVVVLNTRRATSPTRLVTAAAVSALLNNSKYFQTLATLITFANDSLADASSNTSNLGAAYDSLVALHKNDSFVQLSPCSFGFAAVSSPTDTLASPCATPTSGESVTTFASTNAATTASVGSATTAAAATTRGAASTGIAASTLVAASTRVAASTGLAASTRVAAPTTVAASTAASASTRVAASTGLGASTRVAASTSAAASTAAADIQTSGAAMSASTGVTTGLSNIPTSGSPLNGTTFSATTAATTASDPTTGSASGATVSALFVLMSLLLALSLQI